MHMGFVKGHTLVPTKNVCYLVCARDLPNPAVCARDLPNPAVCARDLPNPAICQILPFMKKHIIIYLKKIQV